MKLNLKRIAKLATYTIGKLSIDGVYFCDTLEDVYRGLDQSMSIEKVNEIKVKGQTAIPSGTYKVAMNFVSPRFSKKAMYDSISGRLPRLLDVPGFDGVLMHIGNTVKDTDGCILVGYNKVKGQVLDSKNTFFKLYAKLKEASDKNEQITITIQ